LLHHLQQTYPEQFPDDRVRRTLERRVRAWPALHGADRDVIFRQSPLSSGMIFASEDSALF
jgi:hypothetical protein